MKALLKKLGEQSYEGALDYLGKRSGNIMGMAAAGAATNMGIHAASGILGAAGSTVGLTRSDGSIGGMLGAGIRGGAAGALVGLGASTSVGKSFLDKAGQIAGSKMSKGSVDALGTGAGKLYGSLTSGLESGAGQAAILKADIPLRVAKAAKVGHSAGAGQEGYAKSMMQSMSWGQIGAGSAMAGGLGFSMYSSNALGVAVPSGYGYR